MEEGELRMAAMGSAKREVDERNRGRIVRALRATAQPRISWQATGMLARKGRQVSLTWR